MLFVAFGLFRRILSGIMENIRIIRDFDMLIAVLKVLFTSLEALLHIDLANCAFFRSLWTILWYRLFRAARFSPTFSCLLFSESIIFAKLQDKRRKIERIPKASTTTCILWERWLHFCHCTPSPLPLSSTSTLTFRQVFKPSLPPFFHLCTSFVSLNRLYINLKSRTTHKSEDRFLISQVPLCAQNIGLLFSNIREPADNHLETYFEKL